MPYENFVLFLQTIIEYVQPIKTIMKKTFRFICMAFIGMSLLMMASCDKTAAVKEAAEAAAKSCPIKLGPVGEATSFSVDDEALVCDITPDSAFISNDNVDKSLVAKFLAVQLLQKAPELFMKLTESGIGLKGNVKLGSGNIEAFVSGEELSHFSKQVSEAGGKYASILLPIVNQYLNSQAKKELGEGLTLKKVQVKGTKEEVMVNVDEEKIKFDDLKNKLFPMKDDGKQKIEYVKDFISMALPLVAEMGYDLDFRYATKSGNETYIEITADEINAYLNGENQEEVKEEK